MATKAEILARERERRVEEAKILVGERKKEVKCENTGWREKEGVRSENTSRLREKEG